MPNCRFSREILFGSDYGFQMGDLVYASVSAINNVGASDVAYSTDCGPEAILADPPNAPINLETDNTKATDIYIEFTWSDPLEKPKLPIIGYNVYRVGDNYMLDGVADFPTKQFRTQFPLRLKQDYAFVVRAFNIIGESAESEPITIRAAREPEAPSNLRLDKIQTSCS
jgi:hypothetical protein